MTVVYSRILLKLSGEALQGSASAGIDPTVLARVAGEIVELHRAGVEIGLVIGGGNIFRGAELAERGLDRVTGDQMGMLATVINALAMQSALTTLGLESRVLSAFPIGQVTEPYDHRAAKAHLAAGRVAIFSAGTGNPLFTTDSAASLRAIEIGADVLIKATKVDGVYAEDPMVNPDAERYSTLSYEEVINRRLAFMDTTAVVLCRDHGLPLRVMNINHPGALLEVVHGGDIGTLVHEGGMR